MGIHNSSNLSTEWRVANHINMKAFMTICALLAGSASADPQYLLRSGIPYSTQLTPFSYSYQLAPTVGYSNVLQLIKREADPESPYAYEAKVVNPADGSKYQFDVEVDQFGDGKSHQRVEQHDNTPVARDNYLMDQAMIEQNQMDMVNRRMLNDNRRQTSGNRMMRNDNVIERGQMQSGRMMKREAGPSFSYTVSTGHPSEQSLRMIDTINYLMPIVDSISLQSLHQVHPDGGVFYRLPSLMMTYTMRPASMMFGSAVDVQQGGQSYGFRTRA